MTTRAEIVQLRREGLADACVLLVARRVLPRFDLADWGETLGLDHQELTAAVNRFRDLVRPKLTAVPKVPKVRKREVPSEFPCPVDGCDAVYEFSRGLSSHVRAHETADCDLCGGTFNAQGIHRHRAACKGQEPEGETA